MKLYLCVGRGTGVSGEGWLGVDVEDHGFRPLILQDVRTLDGRRFRAAELIFATPPCDGFTDLPWRPATGQGLDIVEACFRVGREAGVPFILENNRFLQRYIGPAACHRGPHYFWGDIGLLPLFKRRNKESYTSARKLERAALPPRLIV